MLITALFEKYTYLLTICELITFQGVKTTICGC